MLSQNQKHIQAVLDLASVADVVAGQDWYDKARDAAVALSDRYGVDVTTACGVIAALSPRNKWTRNLIDAENLINVYATSGAEACDTVKVCTFGKNKDKALRILAAVPTLDMVESILSGPKLTEFFRCIIGQNDVCIDGHAYSIWFGDRVTLANVPSIGVKLRRQIKADYIAVALKNDMPAYELQAITWVTHRRLHSVA
jgi:hypothetical protein